MDFLLSVPEKKFICKSIIVIRNDTNIRDTLKKEIDTRDNAQNIWETKNASVTAKILAFA